MHATKSPLPREIHQALLASTLAKPWSHGIRQHTLSFLPSLLDIFCLAVNLAVAVAVSDPVVPSLPAAWHSISTLFPEKNVILIFALLDYSWEVAGGRMTIPPLKAKNQI